MRQHTNAGALTGLLVGAFAALAITAAPLEASADADGTGISTERIGFSFAMGYGHGIHMRERTQGKDVGDVRMLLFMPHVRFGLNDWTRTGHWYAGRLDFVIEPELAINFEPKTGVGGGITGGVRYQLAADRAWSTYVIALMGVGGIDYGLESQDDGFQFWLQGGLGLRRRLTGDYAITSDVRLYHISSAQTHLPNEGIDAIAFTLGFEYR